MLRDMHENDVVHRGVSLPTENSL